VAGVAPPPQAELVSEMARPPAEVEVWGNQRLLLMGVFTFIIVAMLFFLFLKIARP